MTNHRQNSYPAFSGAIEAAGGVPCQDIPEIFFPEDFPDPDTRKLAIKTAKRLCGICPLKTQCLNYAIESGQTYGIWAGTLPSER
jgi:WhiB family redox-sensing transcriptional regulator